VPHLAALDRAADELQHRAKSKTMPIEGPDAVYQRLSEYATRLSKVVTVHGMFKDPGFAEADMVGITAEGLINRLMDLIEGVTGTRPSAERLSRCYFAWVPELRTRVLFGDSEPSDEEPLNPGGRRPGFGIHGGPLVRLLEFAREMGISDLPLHPLGLLPTDPGDPVLTLPPRPHLLHGDQLALFVVRHDMGEIRTYRHIVEGNLAALAPALPNYRSLPWQVEVLVTDESSPGRFGGHVESRVTPRASHDQVILIDQAPAGDRWWNKSSSMAAYGGVIEAAYQMIESDLRSVLGGHEALGAFGSLEL
jgi:hypothetical protein